MKHEIKLYLRLSRIRLYTMLLVIIFGLLRIIYEFTLTGVRIILFIPIVLWDNFYDKLIRLLSQDMDSSMENL